MQQRDIVIIAITKEGIKYFILKNWIRPHCSNQKLSVTHDMKGLDQGSRVTCCANFNQPGRVICDSTFRRCYVFVVRGEK